MTGILFFMIGTAFLEARADTVSVADATRGTAAQKHTGKKWRVAYIEGGPFVNYQQILAGTVRGLARLGLIQNGNVKIPANTESTASMWEWLSRNAGGDSLEFVENAYYSANWDGDRRLQEHKAILSRIAEQKDIDLILAFGTWSAVDMATTVQGVPVFAMSVSDPIGAGVILSAEDSGRDNVHAQIEPGRYKRQISIFHEIFKFKKLGILYEDTPEGRSTCALPVIESAAQELGIELVRCTTQLDLPDQKQAFENLRQCVDTLSTSSDAVYLTITSGMQGDQFGEILKPLITAQIPSFSQSGSSEVRQGILMSLAQENFLDIGMFEAESIQQVVKGTLPRRVNQIFEPAIGLAINLKMSMRIGWNPPLEVLAAVDEIYQQLFLQK